MSGWLSQAVTLFDRWLQESFSWLREMREAQARAETLLRESLSEAEYKSLRDLGHLEIPSHCRPGRLYHVPAHGGRVKVFEEGRFCGELCVGPVDHLPTPDVVLSHKLMIEGCEEDYLKVARWIQALMPPYAFFDFDHDERSQHPSDRSGPNLPPY